MTTRLVGCLPSKWSGSLSSTWAGWTRIDLREVRESRSLCHRLVVAHGSVGEEEFIDAEQVSGVVSEMRRFLRSLPDGQDAEPTAAADGGGG